jgi:exo-1,4-beta-D-glucosaminidase
MRKPLKDNWFLICSKDINNNGKLISTVGYTIDKWYPVKVPCTVAAALVDNGFYDDPYYGLNLTKLPGYKKRRDIIFSLQEKPLRSPFRKPWWYRTEFIIGNKLKSKRIWLNLRGINYSANIWLNGKKIADTDDIKGTFRLYDFDITDFVIFGGKNALAIEIFSPGPDSLALTFIDWAPSMPDDNMGVWQPVILYSTGPVALKNTFVSSKVKIGTSGEAGLKGTELKDVEAELEVETEVINTWNKTVEAKIEFELEKIVFEKSIILKPLSTEKLVFTGRDFPELNIKNPRLWWPYQLGKPELYEIKLILKVKDYGKTEDGMREEKEDVFGKGGIVKRENGSVEGDTGRKDELESRSFNIRAEDHEAGYCVSDSIKITFGIRDIKAVINEYGVRQFIVNGKKLLIRGAAWTPDLMLRQSKRQDEIDTDFILNLNLNAIRFEGKLATDYFWELCDKKGILVIAGWPCCNHFEKWEKWKDDDINVAAESERSQILRLRNHPSFAAWLYGSDFPPPENVEKVYLGVLKETYSNLPAISSASHKISKLTGISGFKMTGPYSYVPPVYWYDRERPGYAEGFNTETCPDACIPTIESIKKMLPEDQMFVGSRVWNHHTGVGKFCNTKDTDKAITKRYGKPQNIADYSKTAQLMGYESWRAMYEAHNRNFPMATGVIGWKLNSPWPSLIWQLYDYYMNPTGVFFGTKKACEPLHIQYSYDDHSIWIINNEQQDYQDIEVSVEVYNFDLTRKLSKKVEISAEKESRKKVFILPEIGGLSEVYFLKLCVKNNEAGSKVNTGVTSVNDGVIKSSQLYWLTTNKDVFTGEDLWYGSLLKNHADMSLIRKMPCTRVEVSLNSRKVGCNYHTDITIRNSGNYIAFFVWIKLYDKKTNEIIAPVFWSDNCISLFPGESIGIRGIIPEDTIFKDKTCKDTGPRGAKNTEGVEDTEDTEDAEDTGGTKDTKDTRGTGDTTLRNSTNAESTGSSSINDSIAVKVEGWNC